MLADFDIFVDDDADDSGADDRPRLVPEAVIEDIARRIADRTSAA